MSKYCGKCDLYDSLSIWGLVDNGKFAPDAPERIRRWHVSVAGKPLDIRKPEDLVPYFPFIVASGGFSKESCTVNLSAESYNDSRSKEHFAIAKDYMLRARRKAERRGEDVLEAVTATLFPWDREEGSPEMVLARRVASEGKKAKYEDLVPGYLGMYRDELVETMVAHGYTRGQAEEWSYHGRRTW